MTAAATPPARIVGVQFLNARPLLAGLESGITAPFPYRFETAEPSACADRLAAGEAVAGLVPVAALAGMPGVRALGAVGVAARHEVRSVLLVAKVPLAEVTVLAAHTASRTSVALARLLLAERWGVRPRIVPSRPPLDAMLAGADAAVIIGDPALAVCGRTGLVEVDLAGAWVEWTGLPFVFALWGVAPAAPTGIGPVLERSFEFAREHWGEFLPRWAREHGVGLEGTRVYLEDTLTYRLGDGERTGAQEFLRRAADAGLLPRRDEVWRDD
ncbi:MAG: menaquinone biosynthesis protein [Thermoanaerobaculaceae bacterium]|nr:menaquinone biosynthesis protein [Thermoanaerobaculaceae bacterium]TAM56913.1 MAG: hypothetical protein EPN53_00485 [Acidobacteriota bacterium]